MIPCRAGGRLSLVFDVGGTELCDEVGQGPDVGGHAPPVASGIGKNVVLFEHHQGEVDCCHLRDVIMGDSRYTS